MAELSAGVAVDVRLSADQSGSTEHEPSAELTELLKRAGFDWLDARTTDNHYLWSEGIAAEGDAVVVYGVLREAEAAAREGGYRGGPRRLRIEAPEVGSVILTTLPSNTVAEGAASARRRSVAGHRAERRGGGAANSNVYWRRWRAVLVARWSFRRGRRPLPDRPTHRCRLLQHVRRHLGGRSGAAPRQPAPREDLRQAPRDRAHVAAERHGVPALRGEPRRDRREIPVDWCGTCFGVWLDGGEYQALNAPRRRARPSQVACYACKREVALGDTCYTDEGLVCLECSGEQLAEMKKREAILQEELRRDEAAQRAQERREARARIGQLRSDLRYASAHELDALRRVLEDS